MKALRVYSYYLFAVVFLFGCSKPSKAELDYERIIFALAIEELPNSTTIVECVVDNWTDYIIDAKLSTTPQDFEMLIKGRDWKVKNEQNNTIYRWTLNKNGLPACTLKVNKEKTEVILEYGAD